MTVLEFDCRVRERQQRSGCFRRKPEAESGRNPEDEGGGPLWTGGSVDITCHMRGFNTLSTLTSLSFQSESGDKMVLLKPKWCTQS